MPIENPTAPPQKPRSAIQGTTPARPPCTARRTAARCPPGKTTGPPADDRVDPPHCTPTPTAGETPRTEPHDPRRPPYLINPDTTLQEPHRDLAREAGTKRGTPRTRKKPMAGTSTSPASTRTRNQARPTNTLSPIPHPGSLRTKKGAYSRENRTACLNRVCMFTRKERRSPNDAISRGRKPTVKQKNLHEMRGIQRDSRPTMPPMPIHRTADQSQGRTRRLKGPHLPPHTTR